MSHQRDPDWSTPSGWMYGIFYDWWNDHACCVAGTPKTPPIFKMGIEKTCTNVSSEIWCRYWQRTLFEQPAAIGSKDHRSVGSLFMHVNCPQTGIDEAYDKGRKLAEGVRNAYILLYRMERKPNTRSTSILRPPAPYSNPHGVWFRNQRIREISPYRSHYVFTVAINYEYYFRPSLI